MPPDRDRPHIAVIGSGAAAAGVLLACAQRFPSGSITLMERRRDDAPPEPGAGRQSDPAYWRELYASMRAQAGRKFPPPKTRFGAVAPRLAVEGGGPVWQSRERGGLTNYWGGSTAVFRQRDFDRWPIALLDLAPFYRMAADAIGISGEIDDLSPHFESETLNRPPIRVSETTKRLIGAVNRSTPAFGFGIRAGIARLALETRGGHEHECISCGHCMVGCLQQSVYSARTTVDRFIRSGMRVLSGKVIAFDASSRRLTLEDEQTGRRDQVGPFDLIFLAAGCIGTSEIVLRSTSHLDSLGFRDNPVASFPIFYLGRLEGASEAGHVALANALLAAIPETTSSGHAFSVQIYPFLDHLWRYVVPGSVWPPFEWMGRAVRRRLMIGRLYLHSDHGPRYSLALDNRGMPTIRLEQPRSVQPGAWQALRSALSRHGFYVPPKQPVAQHTSSHYSGSLPYGSSGGPTAGGEIAPGVFVCDSSVFPDAPAWSPTLTIMANAMRTASYAGEILS
ncbi:hypothetical protein K32_01670 [Kaistia sp. 32K]|uniref:GMC family oxidoreductase n=1 Tax=Kaistia sp. 32K TaxID=2795690 RepID=UPI0019167A69|nr:GMC family oxidoreductase [Kaistia sp. 32K]BCP51550.1 hypothetical protein K32_01670 [Kaistia sp. 32K]